MNLAMLVLRVVVGGLFVGHGGQKLFGWFGGHGLEGTGAFFESTGIRPGRLMALMAGAGELVGGVLFGLGLITPLGAALITGVMVTAVWTVHRVNGLWVSDGGFEYNLVLVAVVFAVTVAGPGSWSLDHAWNIDLSGYAWAMIEIGAGVLGGVAAWVLGRLTGRRHRRRGGEGAVATGV